MRTPSFNSGYGVLKGLLEELWVRIRFMITGLWQE